MTTSPARPARAQRLTDGVLILIVLLVGAMAGAASFTHVHDWTIENSPAGTGDWFGWANAVITELIPIASLIVIARRRATGTPIGYPMFLLVVSVGLSLTAQLAVAEPSVFGWMVSALPALAFFALSKLVFSATTPRPTTNPVTASTPAPAPAPSIDTAPAPGRQAAVPTTRATTAQDTPPADETSATRTAAATATALAAPEPHPAEPASVPAPARAVPSGERFPAALLANARTIAAAHRDSHGDDIRPTQLAARLRVPTHTAADILTQLATAPTPATIRPHNGSTVTAITGVPA
jgi:hypothetical protein